MRSPLYTLSTIAALALVVIAPARSLAEINSPEALKAQIQWLQPSNLVWRQIEWRYCLLDGIQAAREQKKPILFWAFINADPSEERC